MIDYLGRRTSSFALWARRVSWFAVVLFIVAGLGHRYGMVETLAFFWLLGLVFALVAAGLLLAWIGFSQVWEQDAKGGRAILSALVAGVIALGPFALSGYGFFTNPALSDISTDLADPPRFERLARARAGAMNEIAEEITPANAALQVENYPQVAGRRYEARAEDVLAALETVVAPRGWTLLPIGTPRRGTYEFETEAPTFLVRLPADAALRIAERGDGVLVDMRLVSRYGAHDLGDNARRIARFMNDLDREMAAVASRPDIISDR